MYTYLLFEIKKYILQVCITINNLISYHFLFRPEGKRLRSKQELANYIEKNNLPFIPEEFIFRKSAYISKMPMIEYNKDSS